MAKRRASSSSPLDGPVKKKQSLSTMQAVAVYESKTLSTRNELQRAPPPAFKAFGPWERTSTTNLRTKPKRIRATASVGDDRPPAFRPGLELASQQLQVPAGCDVAIVKEIILVPTTLAVIKPNWPFCFDVNCTPQLGPAIPQHIEEELYKKYVCPSPLLRPGKLPYFHIGTTHLGFRLHFYLILPNAGGPPHAVNAGHLSDEALQLLFDLTIVPALVAADPKRRGFTSWMQAMNESNLKPLKSRRRTNALQPEMQEERIHCFHLDAIWSSIDQCDDEELRYLLEGKVLVAYGERDVHSWHEGWKPSWGTFKKDWENGIELKNLKSDSRIRLELDLEVDGLEGDVNLTNRTGLRKRVRR